MRALEKADKASTVGKPVLDVCTTWRSVWLVDRLTDSQFEL
jgi:hypothetical protein